MPESRPQAGSPTGSAAWQFTGGRRITPAPFLVAGIVNITPDSFSDGGSFARPEQALEHVDSIVREGADMVDLGAESTRPGAEDIGSGEELCRLIPVLDGVLTLRRDRMRHAATDTPPFFISIDTFRAVTAAAALERSHGDLPVDVINDVSGGAFDPGMADVLAQFKPGYVLGHSPARPKDMQKNPRYADVVEELLFWFSSRMEALVKAGLPEACIALDPCIGFGKTLAHTLDIIRAVPRFASLGRPLYFGISRKAFLGALTGSPVENRDTATQVVTALLARSGVAVHRVHNVADAVASLNIVRTLFFR